MDLHCGTGDSQRDSRESIRANRFATKTPIFVARQADSHESLEFPISRESPDSRESCESIRANHATIRGPRIPLLSCKGDPPKNDNTKVTLGLARN